jgi:hypothetical protein
VSSRRQAPSIVVYRDYKEVPDSCVYALELLLKTRRKAAGRLPSPDGHNAEERSKNGSSAKLSIHDQ